MDTEQGLRNVFELYSGLGKIFYKAQICFQIKFFSRTYSVLKLCQNQSLNVRAALLRMSEIKTLVLCKKDGIHAAIKKLSEYLLPVTLQSVIIF